MKVLTSGISSINCLTSVNNVLNCVCVCALTRAQTHARLPEKIGVLNSQCCVYIPLLI